MISVVANASQERPACRRLETKRRLGTLDQPASPKRRRCDWPSLAPQPTGLPEVTPTLTSVLVAHDQAIDSWTADLPDLCTEDVDRLLNEPDQECSMENLFEKTRLRPSYLAVVASKGRRTPTASSLSAASSAAATEQSASPSNLAPAAGTSTPISSPQLPLLNTPGSLELLPGMEDGAAFASFAPFADEEPPGMFDFLSLDESHRSGSLTISSDSPVATSGLGSMEYADSDSTISGSETERFVAAAARAAEVSVVATTAYSSSPFSPRTTKTASSTPTVFSSSQQRKHFKTSRQRDQRHSRRIVKRPKYLDNDEIITDFQSESEEEEEEEEMRFSTQAHGFGRVRELDDDDHEYEENEEDSSRSPSRRLFKSAHRIRSKYRRMTQVHQSSRTARSPRPSPLPPASAEEIAHPWWPPGLAVTAAQKADATSSPHSEQPALEQTTAPATGSGPIPQQLTWRRRRQRKQLELWQFILKRLDGSAASAFRWVDRAAGVFRILDTRAASVEWGRYRNNDRMDYEKMARAMRFYYKDSMLRKARQQLHFQFAMPFIEWFRQHPKLSG